MDLESESSALESVEDNELTTFITTPTPDGALNHGDSDGDGDGDYSKIKANGPCSNGIIHDMGTNGDGDTNTLPPDGEVKEGVGIEQVGNSRDSPSLMTKSPAGGSPPVTKGFGLKKWRRIRRDVVKDASASADNSKVLKRVFSGAVNPAKPTNLMPVEVMQNSEGSVGSANLFRNVALGDAFVTRGSSLESRFAVASAFAAGTDSENSEDRSSKSSTAASAPRVRHDLSAVSGYARDKNRVKNLGGKSVGSSAQQGKGWVENSKKPRGERVKIEKENSHSSMESDSRSSNFVFMQGDCSVTSNRKQSGRSMNYDRENSDEAHAGEQQFSVKVHTGYGQENVGEVGDVSEDELAVDASCTDKGDKKDYHRPSADQDPLVASVLSLQSVQKALENEVQKLGEIGKVSSAVEDSFLGNPEIHKSNVSDQFESESIKESSSLEFRVLSLTQNVKNLESSLEEANAMLKAKESRVAELEASLNGDKSPKEESASNTELQQEKSREIEDELEGLFRQKMEAEIECLALTRSLQKMRVAAGDQISLFEEQEALAGEQVQMLNKLGKAESKAALLKKQAEELEKYCGDVLETKEVFKMQSQVCKVTACFFIQLILLILVFWFLVLQLSPNSGVVVPT
ncbi:unnamed protein product [Dovyalis caffra]|uniref:WPP domain-interacting protein 1 n=1 Tax=Dovyalis caffra TaxID=77055 RepID=A0AAV1QQQ8_9ROSI|nr:unnamed protein product [Dovyalis caffra]